MPKAWESLVLLENTAQISEPIRLIGTRDYCMLLDHTQMEKALNVP